MRSFFNSMTGWAVVAGVLLVIGLYTAIMNLQNGYADFSLSMYNARFIYLIAIPLLTMRTLSDEKRQHTDQLLYSSALNSYDIIVGKYLATVTVLAIPSAITCLYPLILSNHGRVPMGTAYSSILAFFMIGVALCAVGTFFSALSSNRFVSALESFAAIMICYFADELQMILSTKISTALIFFSVAALALGAVMFAKTRSLKAAIITFAVPEIILAVIYFAAPQMLDGSVSAVISSIAVFSVLDTFCNGLFDIPALLYCLPAAWLFVFFSVQEFEKRRWS